MDYNSKFQKLIIEANKDGYELIDGKFEKIQDDKFPVMEIFFVDNTTCEDYGYFHIYKRTTKISQDDYNSILSYAKENNYKEFKCNFEKSNDFVNEIIFKNDDSCIDFQNRNVGGNIKIAYSDDYYIYSDGDECVDLYFTKEDDDDDFPRGYISFYMIEMQDFEKAERVNLHLKKFMREN